jgi:phosphoribosylformylglycinamidine synthase
MSIVDDVNKTVTMDLKKPGNLLFVVGLTKNELGGSHYYKVNDQLGANVPTVDLETAPKIAVKIHEAIGAGLVASCHDCSEGGIAVALAEMAFASELGIEANLSGLPTSDDCNKPDSLLFSESNTRYVVEVAPENFDAFAKLMLNLPFGQVGEVVTDKQLTVTTNGTEKVIDIDLASLKNAWQKPLDW